MSSVSVGNPHAVCFTDINIDDINTSLGSATRYGVVIGSFGGSTPCINVEITAKGKSSAMPLIKDGDLKRAINYEVETNG